MSTPPDFIVHDSKDDVGVVVVEGIASGQTVTGWVMESDSTIALVAHDAIPLGHKIALHPIAEGDAVLKYGHDIGRAVAGIATGHHVHVHNLKTKRW